MDDLDTSGTSNYDSLLGNKLQNKLAQQTVELESLRKRMDILHKNNEELRSHVSEVKRSQ